jgi:single-strand DNA-binding protein
MYNTIITMGHLVKDPETRQTSTGKTICTMRMCISEDQAKNKCFIDVESWEKTAEACAKFLTKGRSVMVEGELCLSSWTGKDGSVQSKNFIRANKVKFLNFPQKKDHGDGPAESRATFSKAEKPQSVVEDEDDSDIPF